MSIQTPGSRQATPAEVLLVPMPPSPSTEANAGIDRLFEAAQEVRELAYARYSRFRVGAALRDETGAIHRGCNVENAAYPVGLCAEAGAIAAMLASGGRQIRAILVLGDGAIPVTPCGACRQRIREFAEPSTPIYVADLSGIRACFTLDALLPHAFGPETLRAGD